MDNSRWRLVLSLVGVLGLLCIGLWQRWPLIQSADCLDSDAAITLLMGRHFAHGEVSWFFWGQHYMGSLEPALLAPLCRIGLDTPAVACWLALALVLFQILLAVRLSLQLGGDPWSTALLLATPSAITAFWTSRLYGGRLAATALGTLALCLVLNQPRQRGLLVMAALTMGIACYGDLLMLLWSIPLGVYLYHRQLGARTFGAVMILCLALMALLIASCGDSVSLLGTLSKVVKLYLTNVLYMFTDALPLLLGYDFLSKEAWAERAIPWVAFSVLSVLVVMQVLWSLWKLRKRAEVRLLMAIPMLFLLAFPLKGTVIACIRYLLPALPVVAVLLGMAVKTWPRWTRCAVCFLVIPPLYSMRLSQISPQGPAAAMECRRQAAVVGQAMQKSGARALWTDYWDGYRFAVQLREPWPVALVSGLDRRPDWTRAAQRLSPVAYLLRPKSTDLGTAHSEIKQRLLQQGAVRIDLDVQDAELWLTRSALTDSAPPR
jgi:hypothetical protein